MRPPPPMILSLLILQIVHRSTGSKNRSLRVVLALMPANLSELEVYYRHVNCIVGKELVPSVAAADAADYPMLIQQSQQQETPSIDTERSPTNVTVALGKTALLSCRVRAWNNRTQVAWIRYRDLQLLTVANQTYAADQRFTAGMTGSGEAWSLQISNVQFKDAGGYECQIGLTPRISHYIHLSVVEPTTVILGGSEMHIDIGSTINLTCVIQHTPEPPDHVFWTHNQQTVNYDSKRGGISVMVERGSTTLSSLLIQKAARQDSGVYVCSPSSAPAAQASIHILEGERPAAMYSHSTRDRRPTYLTLLSLTTIICQLARRRPL